MTPRALIPRTIDDIKQTIAAFSPTERALFYAFLVLFAISCIGILWHVNNTYFAQVPARGGTYTEGIVGTPRFINPLLATSDADQDLTSLTYSGLLRPTPDGTLANALAESYTVSEDGRTYVFTLREDALFHDGTPVTADDVVFTVLLAQDPALKSPRRANWEGVAVEKLDDRRVQFTLMEPYGPFLENTVMGVLPKHLWKDVTPEQFAFSQFNVEPVGTGPYRIKRVHRNAAGLPEYYELTAFKHYTLGEPHISKLLVKFYPSEEEILIAQASGDVDGIGSVSPFSLTRIASSGARTVQAPLPRVFGAFFNQNVAPVFAHKTVREALEVATNRDEIVREVLGGYGRTTESPIPPGILAAFAAEESEEAVSMESSAGADRANVAREILAADGWKVNEEGLWTKTVSGETQTLQFALSTSNTPELKAVAELLKRQWEAAGFAVELKFFDTSDLNQNVIRPRRYDALLFGEIIGRELDLFPFWHSSQRNDPGLNIALYTNISADKHLQEARTTSDESKKASALQAFEEEVVNDVPAIFLYSPDFIYVVPTRVQGIELGPLTTSGERFLNVHKWYIETERIWPLFARLPEWSLR